MGHVIMVQICTDTSIVSIVINCLLYTSCAHVSVYMDVKFHRQGDPTPRLQSYVTHTSGYDTG